MLTLYAWNLVFIDHNTQNLNVVPCVFLNCCLPQPVQSPRAMEEANGSGKDNEIEKEIEVWKGTLQFF